MANNLALGCDCLGSIHYLSSHIVTADGAALAMPNAVCIHEQDSGIGFKHINYRTGRAVVARARELVVQTIITVSNYEYILAFVFGQSGCRVLSSSETCFPASSADTPCFFKASALSRISEIKLTSAATSDPSPGAL